MFGMTQFYGFNHRGFSILFVVAIIWTLFWKGYALWTAVKRGEKFWFVILLLVNTLGILEIIYLFYVANKKWSDVKSVISRIFK